MSRQLAPAGPAKQNGAESQPANVPDITEEEVRLRRGEVDRAPEAEDTCTPLAGGRLPRAGSLSAHKQHPAVRLPALSLRRIVWALTAEI